jgi:magnesium transporter
MSAKKKKKKGLPPGSVIYTGTKSDQKFLIHRVQYNADEFVHEVFKDLEHKAFDFVENDRIFWYDVRGIHNESLIKYVGEKFAIHNLILEDVVNVFQRPKFEDFKEGIFITFKSILFDSDTLKIQPEQISLYFNDKMMISFQEIEDDTFESIRSRIENSKGKIRMKGTDYMAFALIDSIVDVYFETLDQIDDVIENLESKLVDNEDISLKTQIHSIRREVLSFRSYVAPLRDLLNRFHKCESDFINESTQMYLRDLQDHVAQVMDIAENQRDTLNGSYDLLMSNVSHRMNQVMKTLTIISTIFIPLTFLAGIYGMNFDFMPELRWKYGYFGVLGLMTVAGFCMAWYFKKKKWF